MRTHSEQVVLPRPFPGKIKTIIKEDDFYLKTPRFIDHHLTPDRSDDEVKHAKWIIKKIIHYCVDNNGRKKVLNLKDTEHVEKNFIRILAGFARKDPNFIITHPNQALYSSLIDNGFPKTNIWFYK
jgi:hypothetical protein